MPECFGRFGGASVNVREKRATHWLLGIFDTMRCPHTQPIRGSGRGGAMRRNEYHNLLNTRLLKGLP
jgi:hypothetical protein